MKIGYLLAPAIVVSGRSNGVLKQAIIWKEELEKRGHDVDWIVPSQYYDFGSYAVVHAFQGGEWLRTVISAIRPKVKRLVFSPIIDSNQLPWIYRCAASLEFKSLRLRTENVITRHAALRCDLVLVRSKHEMKLVRVGLGIPTSKIGLVKLGFKIGDFEISPQSERKSVCLHVSSFTQRRKNVARLIEACRLAGVELWIAGRSGDIKEERRLQSLATGNAVKFLGFQSDQQLSSLMASSKVFALPTLCEGVGLAALEAAAAGCEIVVTRNGGPPDYFGDMASYVDPFDVRSIAHGIRNAMVRKSQPELSMSIISNYSPTASVDVLEKYYSGLNQ